MGLRGLRVFGGLIMGLIGGFVGEARDLQELGGLLDETAVGGRGGGACGIGD